MSGQPGDAEQVVRRLFAVGEFFALPDGELEFQVTYDDKTKKRFGEAKAQLAEMGFLPKLSGTPEECVLTLKKLEPPARGRLPRLPALFALSTIAALVVAALLQQEVYHALLPGLTSYVTYFAFGATVAILLGSHELGQRLMSRARDAGHASSYLIPGIPFIPPFIPSLGFVAAQRDPAINRDGLFDTVVAGPLAMLGLAVLLFAVGELTALRSTVQLASTGLTTVTVNPNAIQLAVSSLLSPYASPTVAGYVSISPIADGSTVAFLLVFISLLPMVSYDGGLMATMAWGQRGAKAASYLSILALLALDTWTYWTIAIIGLILVGRVNRLKLQDEVSPLSPSRRWLLVGTIVLAFLCLPIPSNLATLPLP